MPSAEICDGIDNDCDPTTADGSDESTIGNSCDGVGDIDLCEEGTLGCVTGSLLCVDEGPDLTDAPCDGEDGDGDGDIDESAMTCGACERRSRGGHSYIFCDESQRLDFSDARALCQSFGHELVMVDDAEENEWMRMTADAIDPGRDIWIGLNRVGGTWVWDGSGVALSAFVFAPWKPGDPDSDDCVMERLPEGDWDDKACSERHALVCEAGS